MNQMVPFKQRSTALWGIKDILFSIRRLSNLPHGESIILSWRAEPWIHPFSHLLARSLIPQPISQTAHAYLHSTHLANRSPTQRHSLTPAPSSQGQRISNLIYTTHPRRSKCQTTTVQVPEEATTARVVRGMTEPLAATHDTAPDLPSGATSVKAVAEETESETAATTTATTVVPTSGAASHQEGRVEAAPVMVQGRAETSSRRGAPRVPLRRLTSR
jgi:hypothetical protein